MERKLDSSSAKNLLSAGNDDTDQGDSGHVEPIWLVVTTKKHVSHQKRLKPSRIELPHSLNRNQTASVCLITSDPQRSFKEVLSHPSFPQSLASRTRVLGVSKIKTRYKSFESRRQLVAEYDVFLADDRVITLLPRLLGKTIYQSSKRPIPVNLTGSGPRDENGKKVKASKESPKPIASAATMAKEIKRALSSAQVQMSPSVTTAVRIGFSNFTPDEIADNVTAVVDKMQAKLISQGWKMIRAIHIKGPNTAAIPIWQTDQLWVGNTDVMDHQQEEKTNNLAKHILKKRKAVKAGVEKPDSKPKKIKRLVDGWAVEIADRKEKLRKEKKEARDRAENAA